MPAAATPSSCGGRWVLMGGQSARSVQNVLICPALQAGSKRLRAVLRTAQRRIKAARLAAGGWLAAAPATWWVHRRTVACCAAARPRLSRWLATLHSWPLNQLFQGGWNWVCSLCMLPWLAYDYRACSWRHGLGGSLRPLRVVRRGVATLSADWLTLAT